MSWFASLCTVTSVLLLAAGRRPRPQRVPHLVRSDLEPPPPRRPGRGVPPAVRHLRAWGPVAAALVLGGPALAAGVGLARPVAARVVRLRRMRGRSRLAVVGLPLSLDLFVLAVRAGFGPSLAVGAVMPYLPEPYRAAFAEVDRRIRLGERFTDAIARLPDLVGAVAQPMTDALVTATRYGHPLAPVLDQLSRDARQVRRRQADIDARRLPIRLSFPLVVCVLPGFALVSVVPLLGGTLSSLRLTG